MASTTNSSYSYLFCLEPTPRPVESVAAKRTRRGPVALIAFQTVRSVTVLAMEPESRHSLLVSDQKGRLRLDCKSDRVIVVPGTKLCRTPTSLEAGEVKLYNCEVMQSSTNKPCIFRSLAYRSLGTRTYPDLRTLGDTWRDQTSIVSNYSFTNAFLVVAFSLGLCFCMCSPVTIPASLGWSWLVTCPRKLPDARPTRG